MEQAAPTLRRIGAYSRHIGVGEVDGRRREARLMREVVAELTQHVGGSPSPVQKMLIKRAAQLHLRLALMDEAAGVLSERDGRQYLAWNNALVRTIARLGMGAAPSQQAPGLHRLLSGINTPAPASPPSSRVTGATAP